MRKYKYYEFDKKDETGNLIKCVKAVGRHNGRDISAVARCHPDDAFDIEKGKNLSRLYLREKICKNRVKEIEYKMDYLEYILSDILDALAKTDMEYEKMVNEYESVVQELNDFKKTLED